MSWLRRFGSLKVSAALIALLFLTVLAGTWAQAFWGAAAVQTSLFSQIVFQVAGWWLPGLPLLLAATGLNLVVGAWLHLERSWQHLGLWGLHASLVVFCFGSLGFSLIQEELVLGLVPGGSSDRAFVKQTSDQARPLPFTLTVVSFRVETYPGSTEPSDYISVVKVKALGGERTAEVRMNQPLRQDGWTIYQSSVQTVEGVKAPVFKLMHNPWAPFPSLVSILLAVSLATHFAVRRKKAPRRD